MHKDNEKLRFLIVEDEALIAMLIEDILTDLGYEVAAVASRLRDACEHARSAEFDFAILDVNLDGKPSYPVAEILDERGVPFAFATGYGALGLDGKFSKIPTLAKPFVGDDVEKLISAMTSPARRQ
ncbi:response regulator [Rhizobium sp. BR 362]|uniref:response regulator n=1 Tax=Rhizobium sp. BR 362 TaxID=3040670 RepID=UPI002F3E2416